MDVLSAVGQGRGNDGPKMSRRDAIADAIMKLGRSGRIGGGTLESKKRHLPPSNWQLRSRLTTSVGSARSLEVQVAALALRLDCVGRNLGVVRRVLPMKAPEISWLGI